MRITQIIFSFDRPLQLDGLCRSLLHNSDLEPGNVTCICRSSAADYRRAYAHVGAELGVRIVHENRVIPGVDQRALQRRLNAAGRGGRVIARTLHRALTRRPLPQQVLAQTEDADFVAFAVDDMVYFQKAEFARAAALLRDRPEIVLWSWRIGRDLQPHPQMQVEGDHWVMPFAGTGVPYGYLFHTDGSLYRREDLAGWLAQVPPQSSRTLNQIEGHFWGQIRTDPAAFTRGTLHAGPLAQASITWQINRVSPSTTTEFFGAQSTEPAALLASYRQGMRLDYSPLYHRSDWVDRLNRGEKNLGWTHVAPTAAALETWSRLLTPPH